MSEHTSMDSTFQKEAPSSKGGVSEEILATDFVRSHLDGADAYQSIAAEALITLLVLNIVADYESVKVTITQSANTVILEFRVADSDKGRLIGSDGKTIISIRHLSRAVAGRSGKEYVIRMLEDGNPPNKRRSSKRRSR